MRIAHSHKINATNQLIFGTQKSCIHSKLILQFLIHSISKSNKKKSLCSRNSSSSVWHTFFNNNYLKSIVNEINQKSKYISSIEWHDEWDSAIEMTGFSLECAIVQ